MSTVDIVSSICEVLEFGRYLRIFVAKETASLSSVFSGMFLLVLLLLGTFKEKKILSHLNTRQLTFTFLLR